MYSIFEHNTGESGVSITHKKGGFKLAAFWPFLTKLG